jgi:chaperonin GroES
VVAVGKGKVSDEGKSIPPEVKVGDKVLFGKYSGSEITVDGNEYLILKEEDILAIVK